MLPARDFDLLGQLAMFAGLYGCVALVLLAIVGLILLARYVLRRIRQSRTGA